MPKKSRNFQLWRTNRKLILSIFGFLLAILGILCGMFWEDVFNCILEKEMTLRPNSRVYENWKSPPLKLNLDIYFFNWTNPDEFKNFSTKPVLQQLGPYRFTEKPDKIDITWHPENASVTYRKKSVFYFNVEESNGSLEDQIITLNAVALSAAAKAKHWSSVRRKMVNVGLTLYGQDIYVIKTADELLFSGYSDDMINMARAMPVFGAGDIPFDKFGWFYTRNGSADLTGVFNVFTGADDISKIGQMHSWNYNTQSGFFDSFCGLTNGSAGEFQPPNLEVGGIVHLFSPDMCRTLPLEYMEKQTVEGIEGYKYAGGKRSIDNGTLYDENLCFCGGECAPSGTMNVSSCRFGSPVFMSYPHFYSADKFYVDQIEGLEPNQSAHEFYMILEPKTGIALEVAARFQVNLLVEPIELISLYENVPRIFFPLIWFEQKVRITPELAEDLKIIPILLTCGHVVGAVLFVIGLTLLLWYPIIQLYAKYRLNDSKTQYPLNDKFINNTTDKNDLKINASSTIDNQKTPDSSPLLEKNNIYPISKAAHNTISEPVMVAK